MALAHLSYGIILTSEKCEEAMRRLAEPLTLHQKKGLYLGWGLEFLCSYDALNPEDKEDFDDLDTSDPDFMVTDFGEAEIYDFFDAGEALQQYPALQIMGMLYDSTGIFISDSQVNLDGFGTFDPTPLNNVNEQSKAELRQFLTKFKIDMEPNYIYSVDSYK